MNDFVGAFQYQRAAENFARKLRIRLAAEKTRMILFGRFARERAESYGGQPGTVELRGFNHVGGA